MYSLSTILLVEDNPDDVELIAHALKKAGISSPLSVVTDGDAAVDYIAGADGYADRGRYPLPTLILLDLKLPRRSGFDVLTFIRQHSATHHTPVIVLTSSDQDRDIERAYDLGANSYLVKPVNRDALLRLVCCLGQYWIEFNRGVPA